MPLIKILIRTICDKQDVAVGSVVDASPSAANTLIKIGKAEPFVGEPEPDPKVEKKIDLTAKAKKPTRNPTAKKSKED